MSDFGVNEFARGRSMDGERIGVGSGCGVFRTVVLLVLLTVVACLSRPLFAADDGHQTNKYTNGPPLEPPVQVDGSWYGGYGITPLSLWTPFGGGQYSIHTDGRDFSFNNPKSATADKHKNKVKCQGYAADPVEVDDGAKILSIPLFSLPGEMGLKYTLYYQSVTGSSIWDYNPWRSSIDYDLDLYCGVTNPNIACSEVTYYRPDGSSISFSGNHASYGNFPEIGGGGLATLVHNTNGTWTLHDEDSNTLTFDTNGYFTSIKDVSGVGWTISSSATTNGVPLTAPPVHPCDVPVLHP